MQERELAYHVSTKERLLKKAIVLYEEKSSILAKYNHSRAREYVDYDVEIEIKSNRKKPVEMRIVFSGIIPGYVPMPPRTHTFKAASIIDLQSKLIRWFKKYGYFLV